MRRLKLGTILLLIHMGMLLAAMVVVGGAGVSLLRRLADDRAVAQTEAAAGGALSAIERGGDRLLSSVKLLAKRPTLNRLLRSGDDGELAVFLADFRNTSEFTDCAVRYGDRFVSTDGFPAFSGAGSDGGSDWRVLTPEEGPMILFARSPAEETPGASVMAVIVLDEEYARETGEKVALPVSILSRRDVENHGYGLMQSLRHRALGGNGNTSARLDEDRIYYAAVPLPDRTGGIAGIVEAAIPMESVAAPLKKLIRGLLVLTFVTGLLAAVLSRVLARRIAGPIGTLTAAASRIGRGDLLSPVPRVSGPEIDVLANTMEEMRERVLALTNDLCKRRNESEAILTGIAEGVFEVDRERRIRYMNPQAAALLDIEPDFGIGRFCGDILRPRGQSGVRPCDESCPILHARFRGRAQATEYLRRPDGTYRAVVITSAPSGAHYDGDVRELHQFQVMREETEEESARRLRDAVLANISHEFRTPLTAQLASLELLRDKLPDLQTEEVRELVLSIERGTLRLSHLIDNLLESSRIEAGEDKLRRRPIALDEVVEEAIEMVSPLLELQRQSLHVDLPYPLPPVVGDAPRLVQVFVNLLANANKFAPPETTIGIGGSVGEKELRLWVEDEGPGLPPGAVEPLFQRFLRSPTEEPEPRGMGLGLYIVRSILERHGGRVEAVSREKGTRMSVVLPREGADEDSGR
ncbi:MAG: HAMP domain-containing protein [Candidatus Eisenbacteria bacterium]|nr:HAMP domain-containing protein [Candidatus Eisenbacteria bacterium]